MGQKFTFLLLGPAGAGKSTFLSGISKIDIFNNVSSKNQGGANTTKILTTYEFSNNTNKFSVLDCSVSEGNNREDMLKELVGISETNNGVEEILSKINDPIFAKKCTSITIQLPCKEDMIPQDSLFDTIVVRDSKGFGDVIENEEFDYENLGITDDVNTILFFSISSIQQPAIFSKIIDNVMKVNLKTPMFLLRRDADLTQNDVNFESRIISNISNTDNELSEVLTSIVNLPQSNRLNSVVFNLPEVKAWKGAMNTNQDKTISEINEYVIVVREVINSAVHLYDKLYNVLIDKMQGQYQSLFVDNVLNRLISEPAFAIAANITKHPCSTPSDLNLDRDTAALKYPVKVRNKMNISDIPFVSEKSKAGNQYALAEIPSYSYASVNFRYIFHKVVSSLVSEYKYVTLFSTFMDIVLKESTVTCYTGYINGVCRRDAFNFNKLLEARKNCTKILEQNSLVEEEDENIWKEFEYTPIQRKYEGSEAIAVLMYEELIKLLNLSETYKMYSPELYKKSVSFIETTQKTQILEKLKRN